MNNSSPAPIRSPSPLDFSPLDTESIAYSVHQAIISDLDTAKELLDLLEHEQKAMKSRDRKELTCIVNAKTDCMNRIDQQSGVRYKILESLSFEQNESQWKLLIDDLIGKNSKLTEQKRRIINEDWQQLLDIVRECKHHNEVNGRLISRGQKTLGQLLSILRGQVNTPQLYNQQGTPESRQQSYSVTKA